MIRRVFISTGLTSGGAGASTATAYSPPVHGRVLKVYVKYGGSPPSGTTDFVLSDESDPASEAIINLANSATDQTIYPRRLLETNDGTDLTYDGTYKVYGHYVVHGRLEATIDDANDDDYAEVTVWLEE